MGCLQLRKLSINFRLFLHKHRIRRLESKMRRFDRKMVAFQRLDLIADRIKDRLDLGGGRLSMMRLSR